MTLLLLRKGKKKAMYPALIYETGWLRLRRIFEVRRWVRVTTSTIPTG